MRIGLFGGTFDPIHFGHLRAALEVKEKFALDTVYLIPSALPPHKRAGAVASAERRMEIIRLAAGDGPDFAVSDVELNRPGPSYTVDTVRHFLSAAPDGDRVHLIVGLDAFLEIDTWASYQALFQLTPILVMTRPGPGAEASMKDRIQGFLQGKIDPAYRFSGAEQKFIHPKKRSIHMVEVTPLDISSTRIRGLLKAGRSIRFLAPEKVIRLIKAKGLYQ
ncbi:MAG: nicotinate (nicotinamide) nucleotide adenylyltransferase [Desulfobacterales bacterium]|nr:nicotinate (nicotinamide) nucleotide adenylyltransferase [Desulfobacterales bacterium]